MLSTKGHGWSFFGGFLHSMRYCKAGAYVTVFSLGISQMSQQAKADMMGGMNLHQWRHGGARGAWNGASSGSDSCMHFGSLNEAFTCRANFSMSSSGTVDSSAHQSGTSHLLAFHHTHSAGWDVVGSSDISSLSSSVVLDDPCKKEAMLAWSCGGSPKSESAPSDPIPLEGISADWPAVGWLQKLASHRLFLLLSSDPQLSLCFCPGLEWAFFLYNLSISSSRVTMVDKAFRCASHTLAKLLSIESSHSHRDSLFWGKWKPSELTGF